MITPNLNETYHNATIRFSDDLVVSLAFEDRNIVENYVVGTVVLDDGVQPLPAVFELVLKKPQDDGGAN